MSTVVLFASTKGGVGKTTVAHMVVTAGALVRGMRVVAIDLCPTRGLTGGFGLAEPDPAEPDVVDVLVNGVRVEDALVEIDLGSSPGTVGVLPGTREMTHIAITYADLGRVVAQTREIADLIVIDVQCVQQSAVAPMRLANRIVIPSLLPEMAMEQAEIMGGLADHCGRLDRVVGMVLNNVPRVPRKSDRQLIAALIERHLALPTVIPHSVTIESVVRGYKGYGDRELTLADTLLGDVLTHPCLDPTSALVRGWIRPVIDNSASRRLPSANGL